MVFKHGVYVRTQDRQKKGIVANTDAVIAILYSKSNETMKVVDPYKFKEDENIKNDKELFHRLELLFLQAQPKTFIIKSLDKVKEIESSYGVKPSILVLSDFVKIEKTEIKSKITPDQTQNKPIFEYKSQDLTELESIAKDLKMEVILSIQDDTMPDDFSFSLNKPNLIACYPSVKKAYSDNEKPKELNIPLAFALAGMMAKYPLWQSPSNHRIEGVDALSNIIRWEEYGDCDANKLNEKGYITAIRTGGEYRLWGNRYALDYTQTEKKTLAMSFVAVRRVANHISHVLVEKIFEAVDQNLTRNFIDNVCSKVNGYLYSLQMKGAINFGKCTPNKELNTPDNLALGHVSFNVDFTPSYPVEHIDFTVTITDDGLKDMLQ